jgi:protein-S-isoprenylcysteine O-methyltransferase Ste14
LDPAPLRILGLILVAAGTAALLECFTRFVRKGHGTPAPLYPTETLIVTGLYRCVRNPMYAAILTVLIGQVLWFGNVSLLICTAGGWLTTHLFVCLYEEPTLRHTYGREYELYRAQVPRWVPRLTPWRGAGGAL